MDININTANVKRTGTSLAAISVISVALLCFVMGKFQFFELLSLKRTLEALLLMPLLLGAVFYAAKSPALLLSPAIIFVANVLVLELVYRSNVLWVADQIYALLALIIIAAAPQKYIIAGAKWIVSLAAIFSVMAIAEFVILIFQPELRIHAEVFVGDDGLAVERFHPVILLGFVTGENYTIFGLNITRMRSFATEPSLLVLYSLLPFCLALLLRTRNSLILSLPILVFSVISLSGSVFLSIAFSLLFVLLCIVFSASVVIKFAPLFIFGAYLSYVASGSIGFDEFNALLLSYGDFLEKANSYRVRSEGTYQLFKRAVSSPFGSPQLPDLPTSIVISSALLGGWIGAVFLLRFLYQFARPFGQLYEREGASFRDKLAVAIFFGAITTTLVFSDYGMQNYAGLGMLMFILRIVRSAAVESYRAVPKS